MNNILEELLQPFEPGMMEWKPGATKGDKCMALAFADLRVYFERLDEVVGMDWSTRFVPWNDGRIICELTIAGITRSSTGEMDAQDEKNNMGGTVAEAQAMKRACAAFGLGRYLYSLPSVWVDFDATSKRISKSGQAELDRRYADWYTKKMTALAKRHPPHVDTETGEIVDPDLTRIATIMARGPSEQEEPIEGDVLFEKSDGPKASQSQLNYMHALGNQYYKTPENWEKKRPQWVRDASGGAVEHSKDLSPEQCDWIISLLNQRIAKRAAANAQEPIATVA